MAEIIPIPSDSKFQDLTGRQFGRLTVIGYCGSKRGVRFWLCKCACGRQSTPTGSNLLLGKTKGCKYCPRSHGMTNTRTYEAWTNMIQRCTNPKHPRSHDYGGRKISVCKRWLESFEAFLADMGECPEGMTLDRIDNDGDYEPGNCRWATMKEQSRNKRSNIFYTFNGKTQTVQDWATEFGLAFNTLNYRLIHGWPFEQAISIKPSPFSKRLRREASQK